MYSNRPNDWKTTHSHFFLIRIRYVFDWNIVNIPTFRLRFFHFNSPQSSYFGFSARIQTPWKSQNFLNRPKSNNYWIVFFFHFLITRRWLYVETPWQINKFNNNNNSKKTRWLHYRIFTCSYVFIPVPSAQPICFFVFYRFDIY